MVNVRKYVILHGVCSSYCIIFFFLLVFSSSRLSFQHIHFLAPHLKTHCYWGRLHTSATHWSSVSLFLSCRLTGAAVQVVCEMRSGRRRCRAVTSDLSFSRLELLECLWEDEKHQYCEVENLRVCFSHKTLRTFLWLVHICFVLSTNQSINNKLNI